MKESEPHQNAPDYTQLPAPIRLADTVASVPTNVPFQPNEAELGIAHLTLKG